jgi:hypothetical protein
MRKRNWRLVFAGILFSLMALVFAMYMGTLAPASTDPAEFMRLVGGTAGVVGGLSVVLILAGLIGKKQ